MDLPQLGQEIRRFRLARDLTQAQLAAAAHVTRTTLNQLENGLIADLGIRKIQAILSELGLALVPQRVVRSSQANFLRIASTAASVSFKEQLTEQELLRALLTGRVPANRRPHFRTLLEESPGSVRKGLLRQVTRWAPPGKIEKNIARIAANVGLPESTQRWLTSD